MRGLRFRPPIVTRSGGDIVEWPNVEDIETGKRLSLWIPGAPVLVNALSDEEYATAEPQSHRDIVARMLPHKAKP